MSELPIRQKGLWSKERRRRSPSLSLDRRNQEVGKEEASTRYRRLQGIGSRDPGVGLVEGIGFGDLSLEIDVCSVSDRMLMG
ncbi:hypothetical protein MA16_Dca010014 [Dendrobium catenatum]|uniref:Uncharacterized protein n=1 Tax=Dendrobium catenatum TaxID=906689 RepID=A0A2I0VJ30_9ASPA|nr:hypothetical protein MA16_Dca010014 [Dendrobium catenatum]